MTTEQKNDNTVDEQLRQQLMPDDHGPNEDALDSDEFFERHRHPVVGGGEDQTDFDSLLVGENKTFRHMVKLHNPYYKVDSHAVSTDDGYILKLFRIRGVGSETSRVGEGNPKPVAFLQHGLLSSSETWVQNGGNSLAFQLVAAGYDVWLGNNRGNIYSRKHKYLRAEGREYFNFSFYEMGKFDLPAMIDYVRHQTGQKRISYIGHS
jgi:pimeloyl-ACP methyl ester carboxylesterase